MKINILQILFQAANFGIVLYVLNRFLIGPVMRMLDDRAAKVKEGLQAAEKNVKLQSKLEDEREKLLKEAKSEAASLVKEAQTNAEDLIKKAKAKAKQEAQEVLVKERQAFKAQMEQKMQEFEHSIAQTIGLATKAVLKDVIDVKVQEDVINKQIKELNIKL